MQTQIINFSIPKKLLRVVDDLAEEEAKSRSELLRDALRRYVQRKIFLKKRWQIIFSYGQKKVKNLAIKSTDIETLVDEYREGK